ncbi:hypothetical protein Btru_062056 [Bulinus truncatus]|nr:hypothetical protein Btru_062056 [Bulinus truncatus]
MKGETNRTDLEHQNQLGLGTRRSTKSNLMRSLQGHLGAENIWSTLRTDSLKKLQVLDERFPKELKSAVSAHVREGLTRHKKPVFRNFVVTDDVPDLKQLMDQSLIQHIRHQKHKTQLMYHSSVKNHDRSKILLFNNPITNLSEDGINKYLPDVTESSYLKWINRVDAGDTEIDINSETEKLKPLKKKKKYPVTVQSPLGSDVSETLQDIWADVLAQKQPRKEPRYHFLTEKEATVKGQFRLRFDSHESDVGHLDNFSTVSKPHENNENNILYSREGSLSISKQYKQQKKSESPWQPLSLPALTEYKEQKISDGQGEFQQGRPKMWKSSLEV